MGFIDTMRADGHAVEAVCAVLQEHHQRRPGRRRRRAVAWTIDDQGRRKLTPEGLYGRRKMTAELRRRGLDAASGAVELAIRLLGLSEVRRDRGIRTHDPGQGR